MRAPILAAAMEEIMGKEKLKTEAVVERGEALTFIRTILNSVEKGGLVFQQDGESFSLEIPDLVSLEIEAKKKEGKQKLEIEISWKDDMEKGDPLNIDVVSPDDPLYGECLRTESSAQEPPPCAEV